MVLGLKAVVGAYKSNKNLAQNLAIKNVVAQKLKSVLQCVRSPFWVKTRVGLDSTELPCLLSREYQITSFLISL
ncbi:hypothetical protein NHP21005_19890 (plasmid) [Helicobacter sp. NHP21005]|nr:hypothetical protein NHP21005_19890 [Helicobacter sp. NHP21005]